MGINKKAQLKIQQMAFMLIAVTIFFALVGMAVLAFKLSGIKDSANLLEEKNAILLVEKLASSPEFTCGGSFAFGSEKIACIDADKAMILRENIGKYANFWGVSNIEIHKIYPKQHENRVIQCTRSNYPECDVISLMSEGVQGTSVSSFVTLCRKEPHELFSNDFYNKCEMAKLLVSYEKI